MVNYQLTKKKLILRDFGCEIFERIKYLEQKHSSLKIIFFTYIGIQSTPHEFAATRKQSVQKFHRLLKTW